MVVRLGRSEWKRLEGGVLLGGVVSQLREVRSAALAMMEGGVTACTGAQVTVQTGVGNARPHGVRGTWRSVVVIEVD